MFDMTRPSLRERLRNGPSLGMLWLTMGSIALVEIAARAGADVIGIDAQHGLWDRQSLEHAVGAAALGTTPVLIRVGENAAIAISQALDTGAEGVIVPLVETAEEAGRAVSFARFPPQGIRSAGGIRPSNAGFPDYYAASDKRIVVGVMIETVPGVANAEAIARTPGLDFVFIGTGDLALSLGCFPQPDARHDEACQTILRACRAADLPCGIYTTSPQAARERHEQGFAFAVIANDFDTVANGLRDAVARYGGAP